MKDEVEYFKEVGLQQAITVTYALAGHAPPPALLAAMNSLTKTSDFVVLPSSIKGRAQ